jgi:YidC/Oxa1 family membrane protein insertase
MSPMENSWKAADHMTSILGVPVDAAYHLVLALTTVLTPVLGGFAAVAGIVLLTMAVRLLLLPLSFRAMRGQAIAVKLAPELQALYTRYGKQPERLQREMTALYKREGTSMFASLTPLLLQWPLLSVTYLLFRSSRVGGGPNELLSRNLFGVPLGSYLLHGTGSAVPVFLGLLAGLAGLCWLLARLSRSMMPSGSTAAVPGATGMSLIGKVLPYLTVLIAVFAPLAAGVYLVTSTGWSALERLLFLSRTRPEPRTGTATGTSAAAGQGPSRPQHQPAGTTGRRSLPDGPA